MEERRFREAFCVQMEQGGSPQALMNSRVSKAFMQRFDLGQFQTVYVERIRARVETSDFLMVQILEDGHYQDITVSQPFRVWWGGREWVSESNPQECRPEDS